MITKAHEGTIEMSSLKAANVNERETQVEETEAVLDCLRLLEEEARRLGHDVSAHLSGLPPKVLSNSRKTHSSSGRPRMTGVAPGSLAVHRSHTLAKLCHGSRSLGHDRA